MNRRLISTYGKNPVSFLIGVCLNAANDVMAIDLRGFDENEDSLVIVREHDEGFPFCFVGDGSDLYFLWEKTRIVPSAPNGLIF